MSMYRCDDFCPSNEELAQRIQDGDPQAAPLLLSQNEGYLTMLATSYCEQFSQDFLVDDLKQEGALALLDAARRFDPSMGTKLLTYATSAIETAMRDCAAQGSFSLSLPLDRYRQLRQVAFLYATHEQEDAEEDLLTAIQEKLEVSAKVAKRLLEEYRNQYIHSVLDRKAALDLLNWGETGARVSAVPYEKQQYLLKSLEQILQISGIHIDVNHESVWAEGRYSKKKVVVYPAMWTKPIEENTIFVSDAHLKYAKPYALKTILDSL